jgi:hypothetical protein
MLTLNIKHGVQGDNGFGVTFLGENEHMESIHGLGESANI